MSGPFVRSGIALHQPVLLRTARRAVAAEAKDGNARLATGGLLVAFFPGVVEGELGSSPQEGLAMTSRSSKWVKPRLLARPGWPDWGSSALGCLRHAMGLEVCSLKHCRALESSEE